MKIKQTIFFRSCLTVFFLTLLIILIIFIYSVQLPTQKNAQKNVQKNWKTFLQENSWQFHATGTLTSSDRFTDLTGLQGSVQLFHEQTKDAYSLQGSLSYRNASLLSAHCYWNPEKLIVKIPSLSSGIYTGQTDSIMNEAFEKIAILLLPDTNDTTDTNDMDNTSITKEILKKITWKRIPETAEGYQGLTILFPLKQETLSSVTVYWMGKASGLYHYAITDGYLVLNNEILFHFSGTLELQALHMDTLPPLPTGTAHTFWEVLDLFDWRRS